MKKFLYTIKKVSNEYEENQSKYFEDSLNYIIHKNYEIKVVLSDKFINNIIGIILPFDKIYKFIDDNKDNIYIYTIDGIFFNLFVFSDTNYISLEYEDEIEVEIENYVENQVENQVESETNITELKNKVRDIFENTDNLLDFLKINNTYYTGINYGTNSIKAFMYNMTNYQEDICKIKNINEYIFNKYNIDIERCNELKEYFVEFLKVRMDNLKNDLSKTITNENKKTITACKHFICNSIYKCLFLSNDDLTFTCRNIVNNNDDLSKKTITELKILCQEKNINFTTKTSKPELIKLLLK
jgi:hypothetical protein